MEHTAGTTAQVDPLAIAECRHSTGTLRGRRNVANRLVTIDKVAGDVQRAPVTSDVEFIRLRVVRQYMRPTCHSTC